MHGGILTRHRRPVAADCADCGKYGWQGTGLPADSTYFGAGQPPVNLAPDRPEGIALTKYTKAQAYNHPMVLHCIALVFIVFIDACFAFGWVGTGQQEQLGIETSNPLVALLQLGTWMPFQGNALLIPLMAVVGLAIMTYFIREGRDGFHWWKTCVAPIIAAAAMSFFYYLMMKNRAAITFGAYEGWVKWVPYIALGIFLAGCLLALIYKVRATERYEAVGRFVHEEA